MCLGPRLAVFQKGGRLVQVAEGRLHCIYSSIATLPEAVCYCLQTFIVTMATVTMVYEFAQSFRVLDITICQVITEIPICHIAWAKCCCHRNHVHNGLWSEALKSVCVCLTPRSKAIQIVYTSTHHNTKHT